MRSPLRPHAIVASIAASVLAALTHAAPPRPGEPASQPAPVGTIRADAAALAPTVATEEVKLFLAATADLPTIAPRAVFANEARTKYYTEAEAAALPEPERNALKRRDIDEQFYYYTRYGTPLAYERPLDIIFSASEASPAPRGLAGKRILDFGFGGVGHLRLLASLGADVVGVEVDPLLRAVYSAPHDTGQIPLAAAAKNETSSPGSITLLFGQYPADKDLAERVGAGYDLVISKNVLKRGYIHPERQVDKRMLVDLGVDDAAFVNNLARILKPGGVAMIYNLSPAPAPADKPYKPWADGRCPFDRALFESAGLRVIAYDADDSEAARAMARTLGWDKGQSPMDVNNDLFAHYTLVQKPTTR